MEVVDGKYICPVCGNELKEVDEYFFDLRCDECNFGTTKEALWMCKMMCPDEQEEV